MDKDNFPSNSQKNYTDADKQEPHKKRVVNKVVSGTVKKQKRSWGKRAADVFLEDDTQSVSTYIFYDVLIPAAKAMLCDVVGWGGMAEMILFGNKNNKGRSNIRRDGNKSYTSYGSYWKSSGSSNESSRGRNNRDLSSTSRARFDFDDIIIPTRGEAEDVLGTLVDLTVDYQQATVSDFYDSVGITSNFTDEKYGWLDLSRATITRARQGGYVLNLPRPQPLD